MLAPTWHAAAASKMNWLGILCIQQPIIGLNSKPVTAWGSSRIATCRDESPCMSCMKNDTQKTFEKKLMERQSVETRVWNI
jgi:hypothetical protein